MSKLGNRTVTKPTLYVPSYGKSIILSLLFIFATTLCQVHVRILGFVCDVGIPGCALLWYVFLVVFFDGEQLLTGFLLGSLSCAYR